MVEFFALSGTMTGVVLDSGDGVTHAVPVHTSTPLPADNGKGGVQSLKVAGRYERFEIFVSFSPSILDHACALPLVSTLRV